MDSRPPAPHSPRPAGESGRRAAHCCGCLTAVVELVAGAAEHAVQRSREQAHPNDHRQSDENDQKSVLRGHRTVLTAEPGPEVRDTRLDHREHLHLLSPIRRPHAFRRPNFVITVRAHAHCGYPDSHRGSLRRTAYGLGVRTLSERVVSWRTTGEASTRL